MYKLQEQYHHSHITKPILSYLFLRHNMAPNLRSRDVSGIGHVWDVGTQMDPKRRTRSKVNKNFQVGKKNRQNGLCVKANTLFRRYNVDIALVMKTSDGYIGGYESKPGLAQELLRNEEVPLLLPHIIEECNYQKRRLRMPTHSQPSVSPSSSVAESHQTFSPHPPTSSVAASDSADSRQGNTCHGSQCDKNTPLDCLAEAALLASSHAVSAREQRNLVLKGDTNLDVAAHLLGSTNGDSNVNSLGPLSPASDEVCQPTSAPAGKSSFIWSWLGKFSR